MADMWLSETSLFISRYANEICFSAALLISGLFYRQYLKYEEEIKKEELLDSFIAQN